MEKICCYPFYHAEININGDVSCCCPDFTNFYYLGNIYEKNFEDIWFGKKWENFRKNIIKSDYKKCNLEICKGLDDEQYKDKNKILKEYKERKFPLHITLSIDSVCNVQCLMCRDYNLPLNAQEKKRLNDKIDDFIYMMKDAERITLDGSGEVFASVFHKKLVRKATQKYPKLKFDIFTNGLLCNKKTIEDFGLTGKINKVTVSLHAGCKSTYNRVVKKSNWTKVIKNIQYLAGLKKEQKIGGLALTFVLSALNFKDIPDFINIAEEYGAEANIWPIRPFNSCRVCNDMHRYDVTRKTHPRYNELIEILNNPILKEHHLLINSQITDLLK